MKKIFCICLLISSISLFAQNSDPYSFSEVIKVTDSTKSAPELYANAKMWFANTFKDPKEVIVLDDAINNILVGRGNMRYTSKIFMGGAGREGWISFDTQISCKDGRYKYIFSNFVHEGKSVSFGLITNDEFLPTMKGMMAGGPEKYKIKVTMEIREIIKTKVELLISTLQKEMNSKLSTKEEW